LVDQGLGWSHKHHNAILALPQNLVHTVAGDEGFATGGGSTNDTGSIRINGIQHLALPKVWVEGDDSGITHSRYITLQQISTEAQLKMSFGHADSKGTGADGVTSCWAGCRLADNIPVNMLQATQK